jgi:hypothetical protein
VELDVVVVWIDAEVASEAGAEAWPGGGVLVVPRHGEAGVVKEVRAAALGRHRGRWSHGGTIGWALLWLAHRWGARLAARFGPGIGR